MAAPFAISPLLVPRMLIGGCRQLYQRGVVGPLRWPVMALGGITLGLSLVLLQVSNARSYLSTAPEACINCHVMVPYYAGWMRSSHRNVASCNDCHIPHDNAIHGLYFKSQDGLRHATIFTLRLEPQVLLLSPQAIPVVQRNCVRCHEQQIMRTSMGRSDGQLCWHCHGEVPHGKTQSLSSTPHVRHPILPSAGMPRSQQPPAGVPRYDRRVAP